MSTYLERNRPRIRQFRERGTTPSGVSVVHTAESTPDWIGADAGAEQVANFIQNRTNPGSYHDLCDSDSIVDLIPYRMRAYGDGTGSNSHAYHVSAATQAAKWNKATESWRENTVRNMAKASARYARWIKDKHGIIIPARRITRAQSDARVPGFISHGERDPGRRTDPGKDFPWDFFLAEFSAQMGYTTTQEEDDMQLHDQIDLGKAASEELNREKQSIGGALQLASASYPVAKRNEAHLIALTAAVRSLASNQGLDPDRIEEIIRSEVKDSLSGLSITLSTEE